MDARTEKTQKQGDRWGGRWKEGVVVPKYRHKGKNTLNHPYKNHNFRRSR
jgi:hypothetical protein